MEGLVLKSEPEKSEQRGTDLLGYVAKQLRGICAPLEVEFISKGRMNMIARCLERRMKTAHEPNMLQNHE